MTAPAVRVDHLGKRYALTKGRSFWALREVGFELQPGEVLGIIGRNGAGKSTLLKILAGVIAPTTGRAEMSGRVGSLLEVGTGFHPDLSGRENVVLAAALLGIPINEVRRRFDEIVDYAGVGAFIDQPVKRYSSGMYMRLAYAITALLRSDILLLDEVLAVGDAEFQKKTKQSVDAIAHDGRTVLFVSHSMASIKNLCSRCIWLHDGTIVREGPAEDVADAYLQATAQPSAGGIDIADLPTRVDVRDRQGYYEIARPEPVIQSVETLAGDGTPSRTFRTGETLRVRIGFDHRGGCDYIGVAFHTLDDVRVTTAVSHIALPSRGVVECVIQDVRLTSGDYALVVEAGSTRDGRCTPIDSVSEATLIRLRLGDYLGHPGLLRNQGHIAQRSSWRDDQGPSLPAMAAADRAPI